MVFSDKIQFFCTKYGGDHVEGHKHQTETDAGNVCANQWLVLKVQRCVS